MPAKKAVKTKAAKQVILGAGVVTEDMGQIAQNFTANSDAQSFHASGVAVFASPTDLALVIGQMELTETGTTLKKVVTVYFSPGHAKQLALILAQRINEHEAQFGEISPKLFAQMKISPPA